MITRSGIALGSNLGDRLLHLRLAYAAVHSLNVHAAPVLVSSVYETEPVDCEPDSPPYLNAVMEIAFDRPPALLWAALRSIESDLGRPTRHLRNAPRTIDLDILYMGQTTLTEGETVLPHPRLHTRRFVLEPLAEIRPELLLPGFAVTVESLLEKSPEHPIVTRGITRWTEIQIP